MPEHMMNRRNHEFSSCVPEGLTRCRFKVEHRIIYMIAGESATEKITGLHNGGH